MLPTIFIQKEQVIAIWCHPNWPLERVRKSAITAALHSSEHEPRTYHVPAGFSFHRGLRQTPRKEVSDAGARISWVGEKASHRVSFDRAV